MTHELIPTFVCYPIYVLFFRDASLSNISIFLFTYPFTMVLPVSIYYSKIYLLSQNINIDLPALLAESQVILLGKDIYYVLRDTRKKQT